MMRTKKLGLINNSGDYVLVNTALFPFDNDSNEPSKDKLISDDLLRDIEQAKMFRIIKSKYIDVDILLFDGLETYNEYMREERKVTKEEYELLKEALL